jgi:hypothetical protein
MKKIINCETGEETLVPLSEEDLAQQAIDEANIATAKAIADAEEQAKAQAKAQLLAQLGITEEQAKLLLS